MKKPKRTKLNVVVAISVLIATIWVFNSKVNARSNSAFLIPTGGCHTCNAVFSFGMLGITAQQTARFSVVNTKKCAVGHPCSPAQVELRFVNSDGVPFTNSDGYPIGTMAASLVSGQSAFLDYTLPGSIAGRVQIRAEIPSCVGCGNSKGTVLATLEVFDNATGKTTLLMPDYPAISSRGDDDDER